MWNLECGMWNVECGIWNLECGIWNLECGIWNVESGMWNVECGIWNVDRSYAVGVHVVGVCPSKRRNRASTQGSQFTQSTQFLAHMCTFVYILRNS